jgi:hypothetical protein
MLDVVWKTKQKKWADLKASPSWGLTLCASAQILSRRDSRRKQPIGWSSV